MTPNDWHALFSAGTYLLKFNVAVFIILTNLVNYSVGYKVITLNAL